MGNQQSAGGGAGCFGFLIALFVLGLVIEYIEVVLAVAAIVAVATLIGWAANTAAQRAEMRRRCPVCSNWVSSVIMTDLDATAAPRLCPEHAERLHRIRRLEDELLDLEWD